MRRESVALLGIVGAVLVDVLENVVFRYAFQGSRQT